MWERQLRAVLCWVVFFVMIAFYLPVVAAIQALLQVRMILPFWSAVIDRSSAKAVLYTICTLRQRGVECIWGQTGVCIMYGTTAASSALICILGERLQWIAVVGLTLVLCKT